MIYLQLIDSDDDKSKFEKIYKQYKNLMFYVAFNLLNNEQDAEDVVHAAFVKIAENIQKLSEPVCPKTKSYVVIVTEHKAIDMLRSRNRHEVQAINGYEYVMISFSALEYLLFLLFTKALFAVVVALLSSLLSLACRNNMLSALLHFVVCGIWYYVYTESMVVQLFQSTNTMNSAPYTLFIGGGNILVTYFPYFMVGNYPFFYGSAYILLLFVLSILLFAIAVLGANKLTPRIRNYWNLKLWFSTKFAKRQVR